MTQPTMIPVPHKGYPTSVPFVFLAITVVYTVAFFYFMGNVIGVF